MKSQICSDGGSLSLKLTGNTRTSQFLSSEQENRDKENGGRVGKRDAVKFRKNISKAKRKKPQKGRMSENGRMGSEKEMTQLSSKHGGQKGRRKKKQPTVTDRIQRIFIRKRS